MLDMHDTVCWGHVTPLNHPKYRPERLRGRDFFAALHPETRIPLSAAADEARHEQRAVTVRVPSGHTPGLERIAHCAPGRRSGDVMITVYAEAQNGSDERTNEANQRPS